MSPQDTTKQKSNLIESRTSSSWNSLFSVCHYGAGIMATNETLKMAEMSIQASQTSGYFGKEVVLEGLAKAEYNGMRGILGGYVCETKRRVFHPSNGSIIEHELSLKPENIFLVDGKCINIGKDRTNLVDVQDRLGSISLHEVAMSQQRSDVAEFLCKHSSNSLDVADGSGTTIRKMMCSALPGPNKVMSVLKKHAANQEQSKTIARNQCENCGKKGKLMKCSRCFSVVYCGKECQNSHWTSQHKKECKRLRRQAEVVLGQPQTAGKNERFLWMGSTGYTEHFHYGPPDVNTHQAFWIKVQSNGIRDDLMIYDQSRKCNFMLPPGSSGHRELVEKVSQQQAFLGRKSFFKARFNEKGKCLVYLPTSAALQW
mmetsp:Transcript_12518/g.31524  ORF Transcript_12518/g.31524 Transcript_12518/m.31524 type:complete len:371 (+) Transcript_12518:630-1742(+)